MIVSRYQPMPLLNEHRFAVSSICSLICFLCAIALIFLGLIRFKPALLADSADQSTRTHEIVFIDSAIAHADALLSHIDAGADVVLLDAKAESGISKITQILEHYTDLKAIHLISHGDSASLQLGRDSVRGEGLFAYEQQLQKWKTSLTPNGDILLYGCNVANEAQGEAFVRRLSELTETDVAASTNLTGDRQQLGDWNLEFTIGEVETPVIVSAAARAAYGDVLKQLRVSNTLDTGEGSLRWAITQANESQEDDLIDLSGVSGTTILQSNLPSISGNPLHRQAFSWAGQRSNRYAP
jgi:hypothetical protein